MPRRLFQTPTWPRQPIPGTDATDPRAMRAWLDEAEEWMRELTQILDRTFGREGEALGTHAGTHEDGGSDPLDHGLLPGLGDDDHTQYARAGVSRAGTISVEADSYVDQDVTTDAGPQFDHLHIGHASDTVLSRTAAARIDLMSSAAPGTDAGFRAWGGAAKYVWLRSEATYNRITFAGAHLFLDSLDPATYDVLVEPDIYPFADSTRTCGAPSFYWLAGYFDRTYWNSTVYADGATAGSATFEGNVRFTLKTPANTPKGVIMNSTNAGSYSLHAVNDGSKYPIRIAGADDGTTHRYFQVGYYTGDVLTNAWNTAFEIDTYDGDSAVYGDFTLSINKKLKLGASGYLYDDGSKVILGRS